MKTQEIHQVAQKGNLKQLKQILEQDPSLIGADGWMGQKPLHYAVINSLECVEFLIRSSADVNSRDRNGHTAILKASTVEIAISLIESGADLNTVASRGGTPLSSAINLQNSDVVCYLVSQGANVNHTEKLDFRSTMTQDALNMIRHSDSEEKKNKALVILEILLEAGADPNIQSVDGTTVLHDASRKGLIQFVKLLLKYNADPCIRSVGKISCFESAENFSEILEMFEPYKHNLPPAIEIQDSPEILIERLLNIGFIDRSEFRPCTEAEIKDLETSGVRRK